MSASRELLHKAALLYGKFGVVAVAGDDGVFLRFAFFVLHAEGVAFVVDQKNLDLAIGTVVLVVGGAIGEDVFVADGLVDRGRRCRGVRPGRWGRS